MFWLNSFNWCLTVWPMRLLSSCQVPGGFLLTLFLRVARFHRPRAYEAHWPTERTIEADTREVRELVYFCIDCWYVDKVVKEKKVRTVCEKDIFRDIDLTQHPYLAGYCFTELQSWVFMATGRDSTHSLHTWPCCTDRSVSFRDLLPLLSDTVMYYSIFYYYFSQHYIT